MSAAQPINVVRAMQDAVSVLHGCADDGADTRRYADSLHAAKDVVVDGFAELALAHEIILIALNVMSVEVKDSFIAKVEAAGLDGAGATRYHERGAVLARIGGAA